MKNGVFGTINLELQTFNYISTLTSESSDRSNLAGSNDWLALSKIPENVFP